MQFYKILLPRGPDHDSATCIHCRIYILSLLYPRMYEWARGMGIWTVVAVTDMAHHIAHQTTPSLLL